MSVNKANQLASLAAKQSLEFFAPLRLLASERPNPGQRGGNVGDGGGLVGGLINGASSDETRAKVACVRVTNQQVEF